MERITKHQLFCIFMLFQIGSTTLFALGINANQDAWIVDLLAIPNGLVLIWLYTQIQKKFPTKNLMEIIISLVGKVLGFPLCLLYAFYYIESSAINFSEFGFLMSLSFLQDTPRIVIWGIFLCLMVLFLFFGLETISRTGEVMLPLMLIFIIGIFLLSILSGVMDFNNLKPILANGVTPVVQALYPDVVIVPYGESCIFLMFWKYVNTTKDIRKISFLSSLIVGLLITCSTVLSLSILGVYSTSLAEIPLVESIKTIYFGEFLTNITAVATVMIFIGGFYKSLFNLFGGVLALSSTLKIKKQILIAPVSLIMFWIALVSFPNLRIHRFIGWKVHIIVRVFLEVCIPLLLYLIFLIKKRILKVRF